MGTYPPPGPGGAPGFGAGGVGRRIEEAVELIEMELRHTIAYVNDAVIPQVRKESISAMRTVAETLRNLADRIEQKPGQAPNQQKGPHS
jgi:molybdopterin-guanine dinucleotide biosynthesis protein A